MVTRAMGTAIPDRMMRMVVATISSMRVNPRLLCIALSGNDFEAENCIKIEGAAGF